MTTLTDNILIRAKHLEKLHNLGYFDNLVYYFRYNDLISFVEFPINYIKGYRIIKGDIHPYFEFKFKNVFKPINPNSTSLDDKEYATFIDLVQGNPEWMNKIIIRYPIETF